VGQTPSCGRVLPNRRRPLKNKKLPKKNLGSFSL
jgi:hypothetical protein